ncbi:MAG: nuclear transport factor 2 family protein [Acidobacteriota bacterium]
MIQGSKTTKQTLWAVMLATGLTASTGVMAATPADVNGLARDVERAEGIRAVKTLQRSFAQYGQFGLWNEMAGLFSADAVYVWGDDKANGAKAIGDFLTRKYGNGKQGLEPGAVHAQLIEQSIVDLAVDGNSAKGRWYGFLMMADGKGAAGVQGGVFENVYVKQSGVWRIQTMNFLPQYEGPYETGWINWKGQDVPITPFHFTADQAGTPVPTPAGPAPATKATLEELERRAQTLNDENLTRNLQAVYGYYISRRMWDDATDLFTADSVYELGGVGVFDGPKGVRKALERQGPAGLTEGVLNDRLQFDTIASIAPNGVEAHVRGIELGLVGETPKRQAHWEVNIYDNRFVKEKGIWKVREMRVFPMFRSEYSQGWGKSRLGQPDGAAADHPVPASDAGDAGEQDRLLPAFVSVNPGTRKPMTLPSGYKLVASTPLTGKIAPPPAAKLSDMGARLDEVSRKLVIARMYDAAENLAAAYGDALDDYQWPIMAGIFGKHGAKQIPFVGYYFGAERIAHALDLEWGAPQTGGRARISYHWRIQPVIDVASDGRSANMRTYLFQPGTNKERAGTLDGAIYPHDQLVLEDGIVRLWNLSLNEPMWAMPGGWKGGWASAPEPRQPRPVLPPRPAGAATAAPAEPQRYTGQALIKKYPPDILISALGKREEHFVGGTGETWRWPQILPMWFGYKNPVSGREPEFFLNNCVPCEFAPDMELTKHGYLNPPNGPPDIKD